MIKPTKVRNSSGSAGLKYLPLFMLIAALGAFFGLHLEKYVSLESLRAHRGELQEFVVQHAWSGAAYTAIYALVIACSLPIATLMTLSGGFFFGPLRGTLFAVIGATVGAVVVFLAVKAGIGDSLRERYGPRLKQMEEGFRKGAFSYLLVLRLIPALPFFVVNIVPAFLGVRLSTFIFATLIGIAPGAFVYASLGSGLGKLFDRGETPNLSIIFEPQILFPLVGLALLALLPIAVRRLTASKADRAQ